MSPTEPLRVRDIMRNSVLTVGEGDGAEDAWARMRGRGVHHLIVVRASQVVGVLSDRDLGGPRGAAVRTGRRVGELMTSQVVSAAPDMTVRQAGLLLKSLGISCLPVLEGRRLVGLLTVTDLLDLVIRGL